MGKGSRIGSLLGMSPARLSFYPRTDPPVNEKTRGKRVYSAGMERKGWEDLVLGLIGHGLKDHYPASSVREGGEDGEDAAAPRGVAVAHGDAGDLHINRRRRIDEDDAVGAAAVDACCARPALFV